MTCPVGYVSKRRIYQRALVLSYETAAVVEIMPVGLTLSVWQSKLCLCCLWNCYYVHIPSNKNAQTPDTYHDLIKIFGKNGGRRVSEYKKKFRGVNTTGNVAHEVDYLSKLSSVLQQ